MRELFVIATPRHRPLQLLACHRLQPQQCSAPVLPLNTRKEQAARPAHLAQPSSACWQAPLTPPASLPTPMQQAPACVTGWQSCCIGLLDVRTGCATIELAFAVAAQHTQSHDSANWALLTWASTAGTPADPFAALVAVACIAVLQGQQATACQQAPQLLSSASDSSLRPLSTLGGGARQAPQGSTWL